MIVPGLRLLIGVGGVVVPCAALIGLVPSLALWCALAIAGFGLLVVIDAALAPRRFTGLAVAFPAVQRLTKDQPGTVVLHLTNASLQRQTLRLGLGLPPELACPHPELLTVLPAGQQVSQVQWSVQALQRGQYILSQCYAETASPLGFWAVRKALRAPGEIRVYPDVFRERQHLATLFLPRHGIGVHTQRQVGQGRDFETLRKYVPGDNYSDLHWKATARRGFPVTKAFQVERTQEVYVVLDASRLSGRVARADGALEHRPEPGWSTLLERYITAALVLALAAQKQGDLFGLLTYSDRLLSFIPARSGKSHYNTCREALYRLQPRMVAPDFDEVYTFLRLRLRRRALLVWFTSLDDQILAESFVRNIALICRQHLVCVNMLRPPGVRPLFADTATPTTEAIYQHLAGHMLWQQLQQLTRVLQRHGVHLALQDSDSLCAQLVTDYMRIKQRQLL
jgi:uncharacterized protein (DUF58 family)